jgi:hypothetical protein
VLTHIHIRLVSSGRPGRHQGLPRLKDRRARLALEVERRAVKLGELAVVFADFRGKSGQL